jgi:hypothetical protein
MIGSMLGYCRILKSFLAAPAVPEDASNRLPLSTMAFPHYLCHEAKALTHVDKAR